MAILDRITRRREVMNGKSRNVRIKYFNENNQLINFSYTFVENYKTEWNITPYKKK